mgnify:CR=1 FL=1
MENTSFQPLANVDKEEQFQEFLKFINKEDTDGNLRLAFNLGIQIATLTDTNSYHFNAFPDVVPTDSNRKLVQLNNGRFDIATYENIYGYKWLCRGTDVTDIYPGARVVKWMNLN